MPQTVYQGKASGVVPPVTETNPPEGWIYIGETVQGTSPTGFSYSPDNPLLGYNKAANVSNWGSPDAMDTLDGPPSGSSHRQDTLNDWRSWDFGEPTAICGFVRKSHVNNYATRYRVEYSDNNIDWSTLTSIAVGQDSTSTLYEFTNVSEKHRYWRIVITELGGPLSMDELYYFAFLQSAGTDTDSVFKKVPVWNRVSNNWIQLNADLDKVDYALVNLKHNQVTVDIHDHLNWDYLDYELTVTPEPSGWAGGVGGPLTLPDDTDLYTVTGLTENTVYTFDLRANLRQGGQTGPSIQQITTPVDPIPDAPINLRVVSSTNSSTELAWDDPTGTSATTWRVRWGKSRTAYRQATVSTQSASITGLPEDTKFMYWVAGVNDEINEGPSSNVVKWATGHNAKYRTGSVSRFPISPHEWGSWRPDIGWYDWHQLWYYNRRTFHKHIYQGYWQKDPIWTGSTAGINRPEQESGRYRGIVTYNLGKYRAAMNETYGKDVWQNISVSRTEIRRVHRYSGVGTVNPVYMYWHLTNTNVFDAAAPPPIYYNHRNTTNTADARAAQDSMSAGSTIDYLRLPRSWGNIISRGKNSGGTSMNGIMLYRSDHTNTGAGAAGYGRWAGHGAGSNWSMLLSGSWNFKYISYKAPYAWE